MLNKQTIEKTRKQITKSRTNPTLITLPSSPAWLGAKKSKATTISLVHSPPSTSLNTALQPPPRPQNEDLVRSAPWITFHHHHWPLSSNNHLHTMIGCIMIYDGVYRHYAMWWSINPPVITQPNIIKNPITTFPFPIPTPIIQPTKKQHHTLVGT